jgi:hypothetical protein
MASDASEVLGSPEVAGTFLSPKGLTARMTAMTAGRVVGGVLGTVAADRATGGERYEGAPDFGQVGYVAVTQDEIAIVRGKKGAFKPKVGDEVVARAPRTDVQAVEFDKGKLKGSLKIQFADGGWWEFEIPKIYRKTTEQVVAALKPDPA